MYVSLTQCAYRHCAKPDKVASRGPRQVAAARSEIHKEPGHSSNELPAIISHLEVLGRSSSLHGLGCDDADGYIGPAEWTGSMLPKPRIHARSVEAMEAR